MLERLKSFENKQPEIVFHWNDPETEAEGWTVINSLRGGAAGGGTRMRIGLNKHEVLSLAKTMEVKFSVCGPQIGGAKSGINFDPADPRKDGVLRRWYAAVMPLLKTYYGTGGDLNVDEIKEVLPITRSMGLEHCQEGVAVGHYKPGTAEERHAIIGRLQDGVGKVLDDARYTPDLSVGYTVADMITGWGVAEAVRHYYDIWHGIKDGKRVIVQGFGNVGGAAAWFLAKAGFPVVGIIDRNGGLIRESGYSAEEIGKMMVTRDGNALRTEGMIPYDEIDAKIWDVKAEAFLPCARSRCISRDHIDRMVASGLEVVSCGANVPFDDPEIFLGPTAIHADGETSLIADFIANCGMARTFAYLMGGEGPLTDEGIFEDTSRTIRQALEALHEKDPSSRNMWQRGLDIALDKLMP